MKKFKILNLLLIFIICICPILLAGCTKEISAYEIAVKNGFSGTEQEWLLSLKGKSAYELAVENGFSGTEQEWLASQTTTMEDDIICACEKAVKSVFEVKIGTDTPASCVFYKKENNTCYFLTNYHVAYSSVSNPRANLCIVYDNTNYIATVVGGIIANDIAIIKIENNETLNNANLKAVTIASDYKLGESCIAIGNPQGLGITCTNGIIGQTSSKQTFNVVGISDVEIDVIVHSASITRGNSGGGLFNTKGELIGITNGGYVDNEYDFFFNYAIPSETVISSINQILN